MFVVDYPSRYPEVVEVDLHSVIQRYCSILYNRPQYSAEEFRLFVQACGIHHLASSPVYPQSNRQPERMVQRVKQILRRSSDPTLLC